jgi:hypothetical protein
MSRPTLSRTGRVPARPLIDRLSDTVLALLEPAGDRDRAAPAGGAVRYVGFESPTFLRRGLHIPGLDAATDRPIAPFDPRVAVGRHIDGSGAVDRRRN